MSAAAVRYVDQMGFDDRAFTAALIDLGVHGRIKLVDRGSETQVERRDGGQPIGRAEQALEAKLLGASPSLLLTQTNHEKIRKAKDALKEALEASYKGKLFANNYGWSSAGLLLATIVVIAITVAIARNYGSDHAPGAIVGMLLPIIPIMIGAYLIQSGWRKHSGGTWQLIAGLVLILVAAAIGWSIMYAVLPRHHRGAPGRCPCRAGVVHPACVRLAAGAERGRAPIMDQIDGLREYLSVAEEERLEYLNPPDKTPELFERFLPYAVALDVENTWAKRFAGVLAAAAAAGAAASTWYSGRPRHRQRSGVVHRSHRQRAVRHDCLGLDRARLQRRRRRQRRRRLLRRRRWRWRRLRLVGAEQSFGVGFVLPFLPIGFVLPFCQLGLFCQFCQLGLFCRLCRNANPCLTMSNSQRFAARALEFRAPGVALSLFPSPSQAREMERREAPGALRERPGGP